MYGSYANQKLPRFSGSIILTRYIGHDENRNSIENAMFVACSTANLYLNCVVSYEMLVLLRNNDQLVTYNPPSLLKVTLQAVGVYSFSIMIFIIHYYIGKSSKDEVNLGWSIVISYVFPIGFFFYIWIIIKYRGYLPTVTESTKQLVCIFCFSFFLFICIVITSSFYQFPSQRYSQYSFVCVYLFLNEQVWFFFRIVFVFCLIWIRGCSLLSLGHHQ